MFDIERATKGKKLFQINNYFDKNFYGFETDQCLAFSAQFTTKCCSQALAFLRERPWLGLVMWDPDYEC